MRKQDLAEISCYHPLDAIGVQLRGHGRDKFVEHGVYFEYPDTFGSITEIPSSDIEEYGCGIDRLVNIFDHVDWRNVFRTQLYRT